jgi:hypothetical protein
MPWTVGSDFRSEHTTRLVRQRMLGSDAVYRVGRRSGPLVEVEVIAAPALASGTRLRFTTASLGAMARPVVRRRTEPFALRAAALLLRAAHAAARPPAA